MNSNNLIFIWVGIDEKLCNEEMGKIEGNKLGLENLAEVTNTKVILQMFGVTEKEKNMENGALDSIYNRIALKNV